MPQISVYRPCFARAVVACTPACAVQCRSGTSEHHRARGTFDVCAASWYRKMQTLGNPPWRKVQRPSRHQAATVLMADVCWSTWLARGDGPEAGSSLVIRIGFSMGQAARRYGRINPLDCSWQAISPLSEVGVGCSPRASRHPVPGRVARCCSDRRARRSHLARFVRRSVRSD